MFQVYGRHVGILALMLIAPWTLLAAPTDDTLTEKQLQDKALELNKLTNEKAMQAELTKLLANPKMAGRLVETAAAMQDAAEEEKPLKYNAAIILAKVAHNQKKYDIAEFFYDYCITTATKLQSDSKIVQSFEGLIDLNWERKKWQSVEDIAKRFMAVDGGQDVERSKVFMLERFIQAKAKQGDIKEALAMTDSIIARDKEGWYFLQLKGWLQHEAGDTKDAIDTYKTVIERVEESKDIKDDARKDLANNIRYLMTGLYVDLKKIDNAADILQKLIKEYPERATYYNDLGYIWADNGMKIAESEKLLRKALELDKKEREKLLKEGTISEKEAQSPNAAYLDSLGWILYQQEKYKEALPYFEQAIKDIDEGSHLEIWDHYADTLMKLNRPKEAIDAWQKALKFDNLSSRDVPRRKAVTEKLKAARDAAK